MFLLYNKKILIIKKKIKQFKIITFMQFYCGAKRNFIRNLSICKNNTAKKDVSNTNSFRTKYPPRQEDKKRGRLMEVPEF